MMHMRKVMKTIGICSMAAIMMAGISGCGGKTGGAVSSGTKNAAKIGFTAALTGGAAAYGKSEEEGVRLAVEEINKKGDFPIDLLVEDTKAVPADSMNATKKLIQEKVSLIIGTMTSNEAKAAGPSSRMQRCRRWRSPSRRKTSRISETAFSEIPCRSRRISRRR